MTGSPPLRACPTHTRTRWGADRRPLTPTHSPGKAPLDTSFVLRHHQPAPNDGVDVKDLRPLTRSALPGRSWTPTPQPTLPKNSGERKKKDPLAGAGTSLTSPVPFRDDGAIQRHLSTLSAPPPPTHRRGIPARDGHPIHHLERDHRAEHGGLSTGPNIDH